MDLIYLISSIVFLLGLIFVVLPYIIPTSITDKYKLFGWAFLVGLWIMFIGSLFAEVYTVFITIIPVSHKILLLILWSILNIIIAAFAIIITSLSTE